jgi:hypothetical protein
VLCPTSLPTLDAPDKPCFWYCRVGGAMREWIRHDYDIEGLVWEKIVITRLAPYHVKAGGEYGRYHRAGSSRPSRCMHGLDFPRGFRAHTCSFELDEEPYEFFAFNKDGPLDTAGITLYKVDLARQRFVKVDEIGDRALLWSGLWWRMLYVLLPGL